MHLFVHICLIQLELKLWEARSLSCLSVLSQSLHSAYDIVGIQQRLIEGPDLISGKM